ncbi:TonB-dependent receptor [Ferrimonas sp. YFM]|uniref:TonB-dependent receptor domain-containing protein n=1 Tax=Ferrimonas sp. YFM TaxID=3028878 RepID=UPI002573B7EA|nr:TonB-dependent receptor [Ferrimonas sp. YFM]BDY05246.1 vitamin B12 transporter BtuB [Ferrimonas sp. YFM]
MSLKTRFSLVALALGATFSASATEDVIVVTGDRFDSAPEQQLTIINTIERVEIEKISPTSVADLLERLPGVSVTRNGGAGQNASISIRGANSDHVLVLVDGIRINSATLGSVSFSTISPEQIERIEVVKGPRASVWGSDAIGGVIQIFTRKLDQGQWYAGAAVGSDAYGRLAAGVGVGHGDGRTSLTLSTEQGDGFDAKRDGEDDDDGFDRITAGINGGQTLNNQWQLNWVGQYNTGNNEYDSSYGGNEADFDNFLWNLGAQYNQGDYTSKLSVGQARDYNDNFRDGSPDHSIYETRREQLNWSNQYLPSDVLTLIGGVDFYNESVRGDYAQDERDVLGVYALARADLDAWLLEASVRYDDVENIDSETSYNLSAAYRFGNGWRLTAGHGTAFKAPTFNDLYWPGSGNPDLRSETASNSDLTLSYSGDGYNAYLSVFHNDVEDLIDWFNTGVKNEFDYDIWAVDNIAEARLQGIELSVNFSSLGLDHQVAYTYLDAEDKQKDEQLEGRSEHEFDYSASYAWTQWDLTLDYHYQGKRKERGDNYLDPYHKVDLSLGYELSESWFVRLKANNLLDEEIITSANYNGPGTEWFLSVSYTQF